MEIFLRWAGVTVFTLLSWRYLWNGRDEFSGKEWGLTLLKMVGLLVGFTLAMLILKDYTRSGRLSIGGSPSRSSCHPACHC